MDSLALEEAEPGDGCGILSHNRSGGRLYTLACFIHHYDPLSYSLRSENHWPGHGPIHYTFVFHLAELVPSKYYACTDDHDGYRSGIAAI